MARENITVSIKGDIKDLETKINQSKDIINDATKQIIAENSKLKTSQDKVVEAQKTYSKELEESKSAIQKYVQIKATNGKLTKEEQVEMNKAAATVRLYTLKTKVLVDVKKQEVIENKQTIAALKETSSIQRVAAADAKEELESKKKILAFEKQYQQTIKDTNQALDAKIKTQQNARESLRKEAVQYTTLDKTISSYSAKTVQLSQALKSKVITTDEYTRSLKILNQELAKTTGVDKFGYSNKAISGSTISKGVSLKDSTDKENVATQKSIELQEEYKAKIAANTEKEKQYAKSKYDTVTSLLAQKRAEEAKNKEIEQARLAEKIAQEKKYAKSKYDTVTSLLAQKRAEEKNNEELKESFRRTYESTTAENNYADAVKRLNSLRKQGVVTSSQYNNAIAKEKAALNASTVTKKKATVATSNLANETIRYLRWAGTIAGVVYAGKRAWDATIGSGIAVNKIIESNTYGIAALVSANTSMIDSLGNTLSPLEKFTKGQEHAKIAIEAIRTESIKTAATFPQLLEIYQQGIGKTLSLGDAFGVTTKEIEQNTIKLSARMSNFANAIGMPMDRVREEMRSLVSANASTDSLISTIVFGSPTAANTAVREASKKVNGLTELFEKNFKPFGILADTKTFEKSLLAAQDAWSRVTGAMVDKSGVFQDITDMFYEMADELTAGSEDLVDTFVDMYNGAKQVYGILKDIVPVIAGAGGLVMGVNAASKAIVTLNATTLTFVGTMKAAAGAIKSVRLGLVGIAAFVGTIIFKDEIEDFIHSIKKITPGWKEELESVSEVTKKTIGKDTKEYNTLLAKQANLKKAIVEYDNANKSTDRLKSELSSIEKQLTVAKEKSQLEIKNQAILEQTLSDMKEDGELKAKYVVNAELLKDIQEDVLKSEGKIVGYEKEKEVIYENLESTRKNILELEKQYEQSGSKNLYIASKIAEFKKQEKTFLSGIALKNKEIAEEQEKAATKSASISKAAYKQALEKNRTLAAEEAIRAKIEFYESGSVDTDRLKVSLSEAKLTSLSAGYALLTKKEDKEKVHLEILEEGLKYEKLISLEYQLRDDKSESTEELVALSNELLAIEKGITSEKSQAFFEQLALTAMKIEDLRVTKQITDEEANAFNTRIQAIAENRVAQDKYQSKLVDEAKTFKDVISQIKDSTVKINVELEGFDEVSEGLSTILTGVSEIQNNNSKVREQEKILKEYREYAPNDIKTIAKEEKKLAKLRGEANSGQIGAYADMTAGLKSFTKEGSKEYEALGKIQQGLYVAEFAMNAARMAQQVASTSIFVASKTAEATASGVAAVANQGSGDPYTAFGRMAAMTAVIASLGLAVGGLVSSSGTTTSSDAFSAMEASTGTSTVLGDVEAQSESISNAMGILEDFAEPQYQTLLSMNSYLASIASNIGGITSLLIQSGGFAFGEGANEYSTDYKNNISMNSSLSVLGGAAAYGGAAYGGMVGMGLGSGLLAGSGIGLGILALDELLLDGMITDMFGGIVNSVLGGLFGKTSVSQTLTDSGIYFADAFLGAAVEELSGQAYQTISTTVTKKSWFSKSSSTTIKSYFKGLDDETERQFSLVLSNIYDTVLLAGDALDKSSTELENELDKFVVSIGKISLKGKTGDEIQETLTAVFGEIADDVAKASFPLLTSFQGIGEGMFETLTRVATGMEEAEYYIARLGSSFEDISYTDIVNTQGDVGFEALLQSIITTDEALYGLNNNLVNIIGNLDTTAEELYVAYDALDGLRDRLSFLSQDIEGLSNSMIYGAGSLSELQSGFESYFENFLSDEDQLTYQTEALQKELAKIGVAIPITKDAFTNLLDSLDLTSESGQELYGRLITLSESFSDVADDVADAITTLEDSLQTELDTFEDIVDGVSAISDAFQTSIDSISDTIDILLGNKTGLDTQDDEIAAYWNKKAEIEKLVAKGSDLTSTESDRLNTLTAELGALSTNLQSGYSDNTNITDNLVSSLSDLDARLDFSNQILQVAIVDGLGELLGLTGEQTIQLKESIKDGKLTNEELSEITNLTETQKTGILEFASNSNMFATEATLSNLETWSKLQLEAYQDTIAKETESLSAKTLTYGDYIGKQEQIDIAQTLGTSYESAQPLIQKLQGLSISNDVQGDVESLLGFEEGDTSYDTQTAGQIKALSPYLSGDIMSAVSSTKTTASSNLAIQQEEEAKKAQFLQALNNAYSNFATEKGQAEVAQSSYYNEWMSISSNSNPSTRSANYASGIPFQVTGAPYINEKNVGAWIEHLNIIYPRYLTQFNEASSAYGQYQALLNEKELRGYATGGYTGQGSKYEPKGIVHANEYVVNSEELNAIGGEKAVKNMIQREITSSATRTNTTTINNLNNSNNKNGIIQSLEDNQKLLASGFNSMLKMLDDLVDYNNERRENGHSTTVTGSVTLAG